MTLTQTVSTLDDVNSLLSKLKSKQEELIKAKIIKNPKLPEISEEEIPFKIPATWKWVRLSDVSIIQEGPGIRKYQYTKSGVRFLTVTNITKEGINLDKSIKYVSKEEFESKYTHFKINKGDIVCSCSGASWGKSALFYEDIEMMLNTSTLRLRFFGDLGDNIYLYYLTKTKFFKKQIEDQLSGMQPNFGYAHYSKILIPIPPFPIQSRIVAILDESFEKISRAKENAEHNLKNSKEVFESYVQSVFENLRKKEPVEEFGKVCGFVRGPFGGSLKKSFFKPSGFAVYEQRHAIRNQFEDIRYFIDEEKFNEMKRFELKPGDLIMSCSGTMGKVATVPNNVTRGIINQALLKLTPKPKLDISFLKIWMESEDFQNQLIKLSKGAAIKNIASVKILKKIEIPLLSIEKQKQVVQKLDSLSQETKRLEQIYSQKLADLEELKQSLLQKAFKGELIKEMEVVA